MARISVAQARRATRLLLHEGASPRSAGDCAVAAGRVYEKVNEQLIPLLGAAGVQALFVRSAKLAQAEFTCLAEVVKLGSPATLGACLEALAPEMALASAEALFGNFFTLVTTFIGERLTLQALRASWPTDIDDQPATEKMK